MIKWKNFVRSSTGRHFGSGEQLRQHSTGASPQLHRRHVPHRGREPHQRLAEKVNLFVTIEGFIPFSKFELIHNL